MNLELRRITERVRREARNDERGLFLRDFLRRPKEVASVLPSSRFLERRVVREANLADATTAVELGPGTGGTTRAFCEALPSHGRLLCIEINPRFAELVRRKVDDPRVIVHEGDATDLRSILDQYELPPADAILSGIPFSTMPRQVAESILESVHESLAPGGRFVAYQVRDRVEVLGRPVFGPARVSTEFRNVPPARVFRWEKCG